MAPPWSGCSHECWPRRVVIILLLVGRCVVTNIGPTQVLIVLSLSPARRSVSDAVKGGAVRADQEGPAIGKSCRSASWRSSFGVHRRTVRQALAARSRRRASRSDRGPARRSGPWKAVIDGWLEADRDGAAQAASHRPAGVAAPGGRARRGGGGVDGAPLCGRGPSPSRALPLFEVMVPQRHPLGRGGRGRLRRDQLLLRRGSDCGGCS